MKCPTCDGPLSPAGRCPRCGDRARIGPSPDAVLEILKGLSQGASFEVPAAGATVGRGRDCDIVLRDPSLSRLHARLAWSGRTFEVEDLASTHGVYVGTDRVEGRAPVPFGSFLRFGAVLARLLQGGADATTSEMDLGVLLPGEAALAAVDRLDFAVFLVDAGGLVLSLNLGARHLLEGGTGLALSRGRLRARARATQAALVELLAGHVGEAGGALLIPRDGGQRPLTALVSPLGLGSAAPSRASLVFVTDPDRRSAVPADLFARLYGLTDAEVRVAHLITRGLGLPEVAAEVGTSRSTVRTHLKRIFEKTGTHRQGELVHLLLSGLAPLRA